MNGNNFCVSYKLFDEAFFAHFIGGHSHIKSSHSLRQIDASGWVGLAL